MPLATSVSHTAAIQPARALVVPTCPKPGESLIGMLALATRANVLGSTQIILEDIGLPLAHPGTIGQLIGTRAALLARVLGICVDEVEQRSYRLI